MKLTPLSKIILLLLVLGGSVGAYRSFTQKQGAATSSGNATSSDDTTQTAKGGGGFKFPKIPGLDGGKNTGAAGTETGGLDSDVTNSETVAPARSGELQFITSASKKGWIVQQIDKFNALPSTQTPIVLKSVETREAMQRILAGGLKPALWSPSSVIWADRLSEAYQGGDILDTSDSDSYRVILRSPLVFLTTKAKAKFLRPLLGTVNGWNNIRDLSSGKIKVPYGDFKWAHADPLAANSGMLALALILNDYAEKTGQGGSIEKVANSAGFVNHLKSLERKIVYNAAVAKGSSALVRSFADDPSRYDFIVAYESNALEEVAKNPDLAVIYPNPTVNAESAVAVLSGSWVSPQQKSDAREFLKFLAGSDAARDALAENFRPVRGASLANKIEQNSDSGFRQSYSAIELPPYAALNAAAFKWRVEIAKKSPN